MYTEQPGWYHAEGDPLDTKRFWNGSEWGDGVIGGEMLFPRFAARFMDSVITGIILFLVALAFGANSVCLLYTSPSPRDPKTSRMPSSA